MAVRAWEHAVTGELRDLRARTMPGPESIRDLVDEIRRH